MAEKNMDQLTTEVEGYVRSLPRAVPPATPGQVTAVVRSTEAKALNALKRMREIVAEQG